MRRQATLKQIIAFVSQYGESGLYTTAMARLGQYAAGTAMLEVKKTYDAFAQASWPSSQFSADAYVLGKREGDGGPARKPSKAGDTLRELSSFVRVIDTNIGHLIRGNKNSIRVYTVDIDPTAKVSRANLQFPTGIPAPLMARWKEWPKPVQVPETQRMLGYLMTIRRGNAGFDSPVKGPRRPSAPFFGDHPSGTIAIVPKPYPVWQLVQERLPSKIQDGLIKRAILHLQKKPLRNALGGLVDAGSRYK